MAQGKLDPILLEVLWNRLVSVVEEQARALMRTSFTSVVREAGDLSAGLFDRRGRMVAQAVTGTPGHVNAMATSVHHFLREIPAETLGEGDVMVTNHPWQTAGHLNDFTVITPVFREGELVAFFGNTCHALDVGGRGLGADARQVYEEGLFVPVTRLFRAGEPNEELFRIVRANVRAPFEVVGDLYAQAGSNDVGGARLLDMIEEFGLGDIEELSDEVCSRSESAMREAIAELPDGLYENEAHTDGFDEPIRLAVSIRVEGDEMRVVVPRGSTLGDIAQILERDGVVSSAGFFELRARIEGRSGSLKPGPYSFQQNMSYDAVLDELLFVTGPLLAGGLATLYRPAAGVLAAVGGRRGAGDVHGRRRAGLPRAGSARGRRPTAAPEGLP